MLYSTVPRSSMLAQSVKWPSGNMEIFFLSDFFVCHVYIDKFDVWYFVWRHYTAGISVGAANMYLQIHGMDNLTILWRTLYHQGNFWQPVTVQLGRQTRPFLISVSKLSLGVYDGISALDDITFHNCSLPVPMDKCPNSDYFHCGRSRACVDHLKLCDLVDDCGDGTDEENCCKFCF